MFEPTDSELRKQILADIEYLQKEYTRLVKLKEDFHNLTDFTRGEVFQSALWEMSISIVGIRDRISKLGGDEFKALIPAQVVDRHIPASCKAIVESARKLTDAFRSAEKVFGFFQIPKDKGQENYSTLDQLSERIRIVRDKFSKLGYAKTTHDLARVLTPSNWYNTKWNHDASRGELIALHTTSYAELVAEITGQITYIKNNQIPVTEVVERDLHQVIGLREKVIAFERNLDRIDFHDIPAGQLVTVQELMQRAQSLKKELMVIEEFFTMLNKKEDEIVAELEMVA